MRIPTHIVHIAPTVVRRSDVPGSENTNPNPKPSPGTPSSGNPPDPAADFRALFTSHSNPPTVAAPPATPVSTAAPTAQSLFGPNPWMSNPGGQAPNGVTYGYNPYYFATADTAAKVAQMVGGTVVAANAITPYGPFTQSAPNYLVQLPDGRQINAGLFASFYDHGYTQDFVNRLVTSELTNQPA
ncbi:MAG TPA: hypothetical protein VFE56_13555 [Candidatus Binataceae bacterium]|jgi:hypothetical protein|nr:hypothetical protein [Candidatus Binataceae bacterium]